MQARSLLSRRCGHENGYVVAEGGDGGGSETGAEPSALAALVASSSSDFAAELRALTPEGEVTVTTPVRMLDARRARVLHAALALLDGDGLRSRLEAQNPSSLAYACQLLLLMFIPSTSLRNSASNACMRGMCACHAL